MGRCALLILLAGLLSGAFAPPSVAQGKGGGKSGKSAPAQSQEFYVNLGQVAARLVPVYPEAARCPEISSPFGSPTRYDGSTRSNDHFGFHAGIDISAVPGTPLLAVAAGEVVHVGAGGMLVGNYIWLRHTPDDTGLPVYLFTRYQHLDAIPPHAVGARLEVGDVVAAAGRTGTVGGHYGTSGYSHLHLLVFAGDGPDFTMREATLVEIANQRYLDPLAIYLDATAPFNNHALRDLPEPRKNVAIPYQLADGAREPTATKFVWPLACRRP